MEAIDLEKLYNREDKKKIREDCLIIEDNTVYEIDWHCMEKKKQQSLNSVGCPKMHKMQD